MFSGLFKHYCTVCKKRKFAKLMAHSKSTFCNFEKTKFMKNYLLVSFRLHYIKNLGYRSFKYSQIHPNLQAICGKKIQKMFPLQIYG